MGRWFHSFIKNDKEIKLMHQGQILEETQDEYKVQLYSWLTGLVAFEKTISKDSLKFRFYKTYEEMRNSEKDLLRAIEKYNNKEKEEFSSKKLMYNKVGNDESYTPEYGVKPIIKYIPKNAVVWCPFDIEDKSKYVKLIRKAGYKVICSHIETGQDFFKWQPDQHWDVIVSNPPFKNKRFFFERALSFNKPFALLMTCTWLNDKYSKWVFKEADRKMELLMFDKRIHFEQEGDTKKNTTFSSAYFCSDFLPSQIVLEELKLT